MAVELTRMDFHVARFMESEDVEEMDACEVGQFCLLLFKAWLLAKDATLPTDDSKLAKYARVKKVAESVLRQFPLVETQWGERRRNTVQLSIWQAAKARSDAGKNGAAKRWQAQPQSDRICDGIAEADGIPMLEQAYHTKQTTPYQAEGDRTSVRSFEDYADKVSN